MVPAADADGFNIGTNAKALNITFFGTLTGGASDLGRDFKWYTGASAAAFTIDASDNEVELDGVDLALRDEDVLIFGDGDDCKMYWTASGVLVLSGIGASGATMTSSPESNAESGYLTVRVLGANRQIPFYNAT